MISLCNLCVLCVSVVNAKLRLTTETQRTQRLHRDKNYLRPAPVRGALPKPGGLDCVFVDELEPETC